MENQKIGCIKQCMERAVQRPAIQQHSLTRAGRGTDHLIHNPALRTHKFMFNALGISGHNAGIHRRGLMRSQQPAYQGDFKRGRRRDTSASRHI